VKTTVNQLIFPQFPFDGKGILAKLIRQSVFKPQENKFLAWPVIDYSFSPPVKTRG
jgi:hypothetical protein